MKSLLFQCKQHIDGIQKEQQYKKILTQLLQLLYTNYTMDKANQDYVLAGSHNANDPVVEGVTVPSDDPAAFGVKRGHKCKFTVQYHCCDSMYNSP